MTVGGHELSDQADRDLEAGVAQLTAEMKRLNEHRFVRIYNSWPRLLAFQFLRGLAFGLGSVFGATILVSLLAWWFSQFEFLPVIGEWAAQIANEIANSNQK